MFILFFCSVLFGSGRPLADLNLCLVLFLLLFGVVCYSAPDGRE